MLLSISSTINSIAQFVTVILIFIFVLGVTYVTTHYIANFEKTKMRGTNFEAMDSFRISPNKYLQLVRVGERYIVLAICKDTVTVVAELAEDEIVKMDDSVLGQAVGFDELLSKAKGILPKKAQKAEQDEENHKES